jgi:hypothetical protein
MSVLVDILQCLLVISNTILLASCTQKIILLSLIQAGKRVVELCSYYSKEINFQPNSFLTQFAAHTITPTWVELVIYLFTGLYTINRGISDTKGTYISQVKHEIRAGESSPKFAKNSP